jgi:2'-5' RNA ligase
MGVRCFVALEVEDSAILDALGRFQSGLMGTGADLKAVERENIHLTLRFLGDVDEGLLEDVKGRVSGLEFDPFPVELQGIGVFPSLKRPRVVWVGLTKGVEELTGIFNTLEPALVGMGFKPEGRGFRPHITLARVRSGRNRAQLVEEVLRSQGEGFGEFEARHVRLKKSVLTPRGPVYTTLAESTPP